MQYRPVGVLNRHKYKHIPIPPSDVVRHPRLARSLPRLTLFPSLPSIHQSSLDSRFNRSPQTRALEQSTTLKSVLNRRTMKTPTLFLSALSFLVPLVLLPLAEAHGIVGKITVDGKTYHGPIIGGQSIPDSPGRQISNASPTKGANNKAMTCGSIANSTSFVAPTNPDGQRLQELATEHRFVSSVHSTHEAFDL